MSDERDNATKADVEHMHDFEVAVRLVDSTLLNPSASSGDGLHQALVARYMDDPSVAAAVEHVAHAKGLKVITCEIGVGLLLKANPGCRLAQTISRIPQMGRNPEFIRAAIGAGIPFVAAAFYPTRESLDDPNRKPPPKAPLEIAQDFSDTCKSLEGKETVREPQQDDTAPNKIWRAVLDLPETTAEGLSKRRVIRPETRAEVIQTAIHLMVDWGYLRELGDPEGRVDPTRKLVVSIREAITPYVDGLARTHATGTTEQMQ